MASDQPARSTDRPTTAPPRRRIAGYGVAAAIVGAGIILGAGVASADTVGGSAGPGDGNHGWINHIGCDDLATVEQWVQHRIEVRDGDASVEGSTAWLQQELAAAQAAGDTARADQVQAKLDNRASHPDRLEKWLTRVQKVEDRRCA